MKLDLIKSAKDTLKDFEKAAVKAGIMEEPGENSCGDSCICSHPETHDGNYKTRTFA